MERYIEAEALKKVMCEGCDNVHLCTESPACETVQQINAQPTADVVKVVYCKDCKHRTKKFTCDLDSWDPFERSRSAYEDYWFCADGEPKVITEGEKE